MTRVLGLGAGALLAGALLSTIFPLLAWTALAPVILVPALGLLRAVRTVPGGLAFGLLFGIGFVVPTFLWFFTTLVAEFELPRRVALPLTFVMAPSLAWPFAFFGGLVVALRRTPVPSWLAAALAWGVMEWLRGVGPGALPWLHLGDALSASPIWIQSAALVGVAGVSTGLVVLNGLALEAVTATRRAPFLLGAVALVGAAAAFGAWRLGQAVDAGDAVPIAWVQVATPQPERFDPETRDRNLEQQLALSRQALADGAQLVIWSETALDYQPGEGPEPGPLWAAQAPELGQVLLAGGVFAAPGGGVANAARAWAGDGALLGEYAKRRLVPFVERAPDWPPPSSRLRRRLGRFLAQSGYVPGDSAEPLAAVGLRLGILICFETLFEQDVREVVEGGADVLVNLSNDAFFPDAGAEQHAVHAIPRSVEVGRPLVRVSNLGIGLLVDARGRVELRVPRDERGVQQAQVRPVQATTPYVRGGHLFDEALVLVTLAAFAWRRREPGQA